MGASIGIMEEMLIRPLKIQGVSQSFAHFSILKKRSASIVQKALHGGRISIYGFFPKNFSFLKSRKIIARCPILGNVFYMKIKTMTFKSFKSNIRVTKIIKTQMIKIISPPINENLFSPPVFDAIISKVLPSFEVSNFIGTAARRGG